ncbi:hypothetical protein HPP92_027419 [Vanilla planifolia]|uniref:NAC domain-containing protein n=1 Tax=Vanilla planifolia TaxID=51239 RepID=A0A835P968_VANPL|nr:hypothetical protein HPP92_027419 [Vanilla planifolia]
MDTLSQVPPGFRFHPTDEELVDYYLRKKVASRRAADIGVIKDVDLYKIEPWDLRDKCIIAAEEEQGDWYFFSHKDRKYPTGSRTNRATAAGFWKATGRDKPIYSKKRLIGMRKTLVFYKGRAPNGQKSNWIMHEYRLETDENAPPQEEGWVVCRVFQKRSSASANQRLNEYEEEQLAFLRQPDSAERLALQYFPQDSFPLFPYLESHGTMDWRILDRLVASQLGQEEVFSKASNTYYNGPHGNGFLVGDEIKEEVDVANPSNSNSNEHIGQLVWK